MSKTVKWIIWCSVALIALLIVLKVFGAFGKDEGIKVTAEKVQKRTITEVVTASGKVYPEVEVKVSSDNSGEITELNVQEGDTVKKGQLLARIYADIYSIQRDQAASGVVQSQAQVANSQEAIDALKAQMDQAEQTYNMQKKLFDQKVISQNEFNVADANLKSAKANYNAALQGIRSGQANVKSAMSNLQKANKDLSRTTITAPMDGVISLLNVKKGEKVVGNNLMAGTEMLRIADMDKIEIRVDVGESDIQKVKLGDSAIITVEAFSNRKFKGIVTQIASSNNGAAIESEQANSSTDVTNYKVYIRILPESYNDLIGKGSFPFRPGMNANADIQTTTHHDVLCVPLNSVTPRDKNESASSGSAKAADATTTVAVSEDSVELVVFIVGDDNKVKKARVKTGIQDINYIEITDGLKGGEKVVSGPYETVNKLLKENDKVQVVALKDLYNKN